MSIEVDDLLIAKGVSVKIHAMRDVADAYALAGEAYPYDLPRLVEAVEQGRARASSNQAS